MKRVGKLMDKILTFENFLLAAKKAMRGKKDKKTVASFYFNLENEIINLQEEIATETYRPRPYVQFQVYEPKQRMICRSDFRDRVVHHAICNHLEPIFERRSIFDSYACRKGKGAHMAVKRCQEFSRQYPYYLKCDIRRYFESIDLTTLKGFIRRIVKDEALLNLTDLILDHQPVGAPAGKSIPIGNLTSQHFANLYLGELDHFIKEHLQIKGYVRYMDDFISFSDDKKSLHQLLEQINSFVTLKLKLQLKEKATQIAPVTEGVPFLGFRIYPQLIRIKRDNLVRMRKKIRLKEQLFLEGKISEADLVKSVQSMIAHVAYVDSNRERRNIFEASLKLA